MWLVFRVPVKILFADRALATPSWALHMEPQAQSTPLIRYARQPSSDHILSRVLVRKLSYS